MEKLNKAYEAVDMLETLGLPVGDELTSSIAKMEKEYLRNEVVPHLTKELESLVEKVRNRFNMEISFNPQDGVDINLVERPSVQGVLFDSTSTEGPRRKKFIIRVVFPDKTVSCHKMVSDTFLDVVRYAGAENVKRLNIMQLGENIVSSKLNENERYRSAQKDLGNGLYLCTVSTTGRKLEIIKYLNKELNLGLTIEKVMLGDEL